MPALSMRHIDRTRKEAGVRAQAVSVDGSLIEDFVIERSASGRQVHLRNAPSPAATSCLAIADEVVHRIQASVVDWMQ
jgi:(S)-2-hydroxyglutarate dehydrogenase